MKLDFCKQKRKAMEGKSCSSSKSHDRDDGGERVAAVQFEEVPKLGEVIWVKLSDGSWWPAVVGRIKCLPPLFF